MLLRLSGPRSGNCSWPVFPDCLWTVSWRKPASTLDLSHGPHGMVCAKVRIRFRKDGDLRWISHHDLMRVWERLLRRAAIPYHSTQGFNPKPRLVFASPLPLGLVGLNEVAELELDAELSVLELQDRLRAECPAGLHLHSVQAIHPRLTGQVRAAIYRVAVPPERLGRLESAVRDFLAAPHCWHERTRPQAKRIDLRPFVDRLTIGSEVLEMRLRVTPTGSVRPDEVLSHLDLADLLEAGAVIERVTLELEDEQVETTVPAVLACAEVVP